MPEGNTQAVHSASATLGTFLYEQFREALWLHGSWVVAPRDWAAIRSQLAGLLTVADKEQIAGLVEAYVHQVQAGEIPLQPAHSLWKSFFRWVPSLRASRISWRKVVAYVNAKKVEQAQRAAARAAARAAQAERRDPVAELADQFEARRRARRLDREVRLAEAEAGDEGEPPGEWEIEPETPAERRRRILEWRRQRIEAERLRRGPHWAGGQGPKSETDGGSVSQNGVPHVSPPGHLHGRHGSATTGGASCRAEKVSSAPGSTTCLVDAPPRARWESAQNQVGRHGGCRLQPSGERPDPGLRLAPALGKPQPPGGLTQRMARRVRRAVARLWAREDDEQDRRLAAALLRYHELRGREREAFYFDSVRPLLGRRAVPIAYRTYYQQALFGREGVALRARRAEPEGRVAGADPEAREVPRDEWTPRRLVAYFRSEMIKPPLYGRHYSVPNQGALGAHFRRLTDQGISGHAQKLMIDEFVGLLLADAIKTDEPWRAFIAKAVTLGLRSQMRQQIRDSAAPRVSEERQQYWDELAAQGLHWRDIQQRVNERFGMT